MFNDVFDLLFDAWEMGCFFHIALWLGANDGYLIVSTPVCQTLYHGFMPNVSPVCLVHFAFHHSPGNLSTLLTNFAHCLFSSIAGISRRDVPHEAFTEWESI